MTAGSTTSSAPWSLRNPDITAKSASSADPHTSPMRTVSDIPDDGDDFSENEVLTTRKRPRAPMSRLVSQDFGAQYISSAGEDDDSDVTEIDIKPSSVSKVDEEKMVANPLCNAKILSAHILSLRLESELFPLRQLVARLMTNPQHNRRGLFNLPVDSKALGLVDYETIISKPMDLGTIKARLHAVAYKSRDECADDVRLVFHNAMQFNSPDNAVHISARALLATFNEQYEIMQATNVTPATPVPNFAMIAPTLLPAPLPPRRRSLAMKEPASSRDDRSPNPVTPRDDVQTQTLATVASVPLANSLGFPPDTTMSETGAVESEKVLVPAQASSPDALTKPPSLMTKALDVALDTKSAPEVVLRKKPSACPAPKSDFSSSRLSIVLPPQASCMASENASCRVMTNLGPSISAADAASMKIDDASVSTSTASSISDEVVAPPPENHQWSEPGPQGAEKALKRAMNIAAKHAKHTCRSCVGRVCSLCDQGCLSHEPALLICTGANCCGAKIRKGATYYIAKDGSRQFCQRCYANLQAVLPHTNDQFESMGSAVRYKRDLLKRKNDEEVAEHWLTCTKCKKGVHKICAMFNEFTHSETNYLCPLCVDGEKADKNPKRSSKKAKKNEMYTFMSGTDIPVKLSEIHSCDSSKFNSEDLPETPISSFIEEKVRDRMETSEYHNAGKTITVRMVSECSKFFKVPEVVRKHFRMHAATRNVENGVMPPAIVRYTSKAIMLFQKIDGFDICVFCIYVQEYDGDDDYDNNAPRAMQNKRVYVAYLDSVEHFRPRVCRTDVYHEILVAYLATARARGYDTVHIWACPPSRGNSFVFWNHPASQRTPNKDRLVSWYHGALSRAVEAGIVTDVKSLFESSFQDFMKSQGTDAEDEDEKKEQPQMKQEGVLGGVLICPPLLDGDFWIEEAVRLHAANINRFLKSKSTGKEGLSSAILEDQKRCPALQVAAFLRDIVMGCKSATPFRKPVNAAALKLKDYHKIITNPMDLGTVYSRCLLGEFDTLAEVVSDVELVFRNAMNYNPEGHSVHDLAVEMLEFFFDELSQLTSSWKLDGFIRNNEGDHSWKDFAKVSMSLDIRMKKEDREFATSFSESSTQLKSQNQEILADESFLVACEGGRTEISTSIAQELSVASSSTSASTAELKNIRNEKLRVVIPSTRVSNTACKLSPLASPLSSSLSMLLENKLELLTGGPDAIQQKMVGDDVWLLDKRNPNPPKGTVNSKKNGKRKKSAAEIALEEPAQKRRRQSWLGEEVGLSVRRLRTCFFTCSLTPKTTPTGHEEIKVKLFDSYVASFSARNQRADREVISHLADARHALLEFSQFRNLEFDTLRRAKYSTMIMLYHFHNEDAPGLIPICSTCNQDIADVRWHRIRRVGERHHSGRIPPTLRAQLHAEIAVPEEIAEASHWGQELCSSCFSKQKNGDDFIPLPVSFKT